MKVRLLSKVRRVFPLWAIERQALVIEHAFDSDLAKAKEDSELRQSIIAQRNFEAGEYWHELAEFRSRKLANRAQKLYIPLDGLQWTDDGYGHRYLDAASQSQIYRAIREEGRKNWEFRIKVIGALTGLIGTIIGLVAVWKK